jgi:DNA-binding transcriptional regulator/RsmH inhibitor MraZ
MFDELPVQRMSPKHQVTLPKGARGLDGVDGLTYVCALPHRMTSPTGTYPVILLLTEDELERRETAIRERTDLNVAEKERRIAMLNGHVRQLAVDGQRRIVMPPHFVRFLGADRTVFMFTNNTSVVVWKPEDWLAYNGGDQPGPEELDDRGLML